jgi:dihydroorotate dehydrogenase electron transfer subunit
VKTESPSVKTYVFRDRECAKAQPGQFLMLWIPGVDEIPLSILDAGSDGTVSVSVKNVGEATRAVHKMKSEETIGVRGPFGNSFTVKNGRILLVGGGTGMVPLFFLIKKLLLKTTRLVFVMGARNKAELLFMDKLDTVFKGHKARIIPTTEDGSCGVTALCTEPLEGLLAEETFDMIYTCGPEPMLRKVFDLAEEHGVNTEASLERLMRCAIGLCGSCVIGKYRVCTDGPVFTREKLNEVKDEFGVLKRDFDGRKIPL